MARIKLGRTYKEQLHGFVGVATAIAKHLTGCDRVTIKTRDDKGEPISYTFDDSRLTLVRSVPAVMDHPPVKTRLKLGKLYQDKTTGLIGPLVSITEELGLADAIGGIERKDAEGKLRDVFAPEPRLELVKERTNAAAERVAEETRPTEKKKPAKAPGPCAAFPGLGTGALG